MNKRQKKSLLFRFIKSTVSLFYPKFEIIGLENLPDEPCAIIGNHSQIHGPIACELYFPDNTYTWCASEMMNFKEVPAYAYKDFWSQKSKISRPFYKIVSYLIAPLCVVLFNNARTIGVFRNKHIIKTFKESAYKLENGNNIIIFPEHDKKHNHIVYDFQEGFADIARFYHKQTGKELCFVPIYIAPKLKKMYLGKPIRFSSDTPIKEERRKICDYVMNEITNIATDLPEHIVVPYRNIKKSLYVKNKDNNSKNQKTD